MKKLISYMVVLSLSLTGCLQQHSPVETLPPLKTALNCLPSDGAITAAHRGTSRDWQVPENSISGLKKLIKKNYLIAEIDVAKLRDGTLITFHDGVWDDVSTGKGVVASSTHLDLDNILLRTRRGAYTSDRPPMFEDMLMTAKGKIYLEIDFKSSVNMQNVIDLIRKHNMGQHVMLITYTRKQAKTLRNIAPDMALSISQNSNNQGELVWLGNDIKDTGRVRSIQKKGQFVIGRLGQALNKKSLKVAKLNADILVTDYPNQYLPLTGLSRRQSKAFRACISSETN